MITEISYRQKLSASASDAFIALKSPRQDNSTQFQCIEITEHNDSINEAFTGCGLYSGAAVKVEVNANNSS